MSGEIQVWLKCRHREKMVRKETREEEQSHIIKF